MNYEEVTSYKEAIEETKIRRISWKLLLGTSMRKYVELSLKSGLDKDRIIHNLVLIAHKNKYRLNMPFDKAVQNVRIGVSSIIAELKIYEVI